MKKLLLIFFIGFIGAGTASAAHAGQPVYAKGRLANGLTYHIFKIPSAEGRLAARLNVGVGAADENDGEEGIAHITEHMVFQSSPQYPQGLSDYLGRNGWQMGRHFNAQTGYDYTRYLFSPPQGSRQLEEVLKIYRQILQPQQFSAADWEKERQVVLSEWRQQQNLQNRLSRRQHALMYEGARQGRYPPIGRLEAVQSARADTAGAFHNKWYGSNNAVLVLMGNLNIDGTAALIERTFGDMRPIALGVRRADEYQPRLKNGWHVGMVQDADNAEDKLSLVFRFKKQKAEAYAEQSYQRLLDNFAAYVVNSRIIRSGLDVGLKMDTLGCCTGSLMLDADIAPGQHREMLEVLRNLRQDILDHPATDEELGGYRKALHNNLLPQNAGIPDDLTKVIRLSEETILRGLPLPDAEIRAADRSQLYRINAKAVNRRITEWLNAPDKMIQVQVSQGSTVSLPSPADLNKMPERPSETQSGGKAAPEFAEPESGKILTERTGKQSDIRYLKLGNGDTAVLMRLPEAGRRVHFRAVSDSGSLAEPSEAWLAKLAAETVSQSAPQGMSAGGFRQWRQQERISYTYRLEDYRQITDAQANADSLKTLLQLYRSYQTVPDLSQWQQYAKRDEARFKVRQHSKSGRPQQVLEEMKYGRNLMPSGNNAYAGLTQARIKQKWQKLTAAPVHYYIVGNLPPEETAPLVAKYLAGIPRSAAAANDYPLRAGSESRHEAAGETEGAEIHAQSWQQADTLTPEKTEQIRLLNNLFNARLKDELRGRQQSAYAVKFKAETYPGLRRIESSLTFNTAADQAQAGWQAAKKVLRELPDGIGYAEARNLRKLFIEQENARRRSAEAWIERLSADRQAEGVPPYPNDVGRIADSITRNNLRETAKMMWSEDNEKVLTVMPKH